MAEGRVVFEVVVEGKNVKVVQRQVEGVTDAVNDNTNAQGRNTRAARQNADAARAAGDGHNHFDRGLKGSGGSSSNATKNFSKMRDSMGGSSGLVGAYATLAANLFAATAAFTALQKAAGVLQLEKGLQALGASSGLAMMSLSKGLQAATGYGINLQDSMRSVAMVTSSGFDPSIIERLGKVAKNTSIALGRDLQDSLNRVVKGAVKLEPELLDELGIMVRIDEASQKYAQGIGKTASQLTNFEKRQAFMNAVLEEGEKKFGAIGDSVDANPYDKLLANLTELATSVLQAFNVVLSPIVSFLSTSKILLASFILSFSKGLVGSALPILGQMAQSTSLLAQKNAALAIREDKITQEKIANSKKIISQVNTEQKAFGNAALNRAKLADTEAKRTASASELKSKIALAEKKALQLETKAAATGTVDPKAVQYRERIVLLNAIRAQLLGINTLENKSLTTVPKAVAATTKGSYYKATSERFGSVQEDRSLSNYKAQWAGMSQDSAKLKTEVKAMNGQFTSVGRGLTNASAKLGAYAASTVTAAGGTTLLGRSADYLKLKLISAAATADMAGVAVITFAERVKFAGLMLFEFMGKLGMYVMIITLLAMAISFLYKKFQSDASQKYAEKLGAARQKTTELNNASEELNKALFNNSRTIVNMSDKVDAQANIVKQAADSYEGLRDAARKAGKSFYDTIRLADSQIDSNIILQKTLATLTGGYTDLSKYKKENNKTERETIQVLDELFKVSEKSILTQQNLVKSTADASTAFLDYQNSFKNTTPYSTYVEKLEDVDRAYKDILKSSAEALVGSEGAGAAFTAFHNRLAAMKSDEVAHLGTEFVKLREYILNTNKLLLETEGRINTLKNYRVQGLDFTFDYEYANKGLVNALKEGASYLGNSLTSGVGLYYSNLYGEGKRARDEINILLNSVGQEGIDSSATQAEYEAKSIAAQNIIEGIKRSLIEESQELSEQALEILDTELKVIKNLERKAALVDTEKNNLETINKLKEIQGYQTSSDLATQEATQNRLFNAQSDSIEDQIHNTKRMRDRFEEDSSTRAQFESKILELQNQGRLIAAETAQYQNRGTKRAAETALQTYQYEADHQLEILKFLEERAKFATQELDTRKKSAELDAQIQSLKAGGTGDLSNAQQEQIFNEQFDKRNAAIDKELEIKLQMFDIEQTINKAKMQILVYEIEAKKKEAQDLADKASRSATSPSFSPAANALNNDAIQAQGVAARFGVMATQLYGIINDTTVPEFMKANIKLESDNQKKALTAEQLRYKNNLDSKQIASDIEQAYSDAGSKLNDIVTKMIEARSSIIDSEQTILENQMKADNRKKTGKGELTAQQESDIANKYLKQRINIIKEERDAKIKMIDLEYKLLEAKTKFEALSLAGQMQQMRDRVVKPDYLGRGLGTVTGLELQAQKKNSTEQNAAIDNLSNAISTTLNEILVLIPGAKGLATKAASRTADAGMSAAQEDAAAAQEKANEEAKTRKVRAYETELEFIKSVTDLQQKILDFNSGILDNQRTIDENAQKTANLRNKGIGKFELTAAQNAQIEVNYQEKRKALLLEENNIKMATIEAEYGLLQAQLAVQKWRMEEDVGRLRTEALAKGDMDLVAKMNTLLLGIPAQFAKATNLVQPAMIAAQRAAVSEYEVGMSEATAAQLQAMEAAFGWTQKMTTSLKDVSTAIGENFIATLQNAKSITQELADAFTNSINASVDAFVDAFIEGKNIFKAMGDALRNSLRDSFAEAAKNKLKEGIAGIFSSMKMEGVAEFLQSPEDKTLAAATATTTAAQATTTAVASHTSILQQIADNTARCCMGSMPSMTPALSATPTTGVPGFESGISASGVYTPKKLLKQGEYQLDLSADTATSTEKTAGNVSLWGKLQESATENVGTIAATGFASMAAALAAGASPKKALLGGILGAVGSAIGGAYGGPAGAAAGGQIGTALGSSFAKGGVMSSAGSMPLHKYGRGGVARTPQLAMFGEGSKPEAYVPLQDGRSIPVSMSGSGGNVNNISVNVAVDNKGAAQTQTAGGKDTTEEQSRRLGTAISNAVKQEIFNQQRPGGILYKGRR